MNCINGIKRFAFKCCNKVLESDLQKTPKLLELYKKKKKDLRICDFFFWSLMYVVLSILLIIFALKGKKILMEEVKTGNQNATRKLKWRLQPICICCMADFNFVCYPS